MKWPAQVYGGDGNEGEAVRTWRVRFFVFFAFLLLFLVPREYFSFSSYTKSLGVLITSVSRNPGLPSNRWMAFADSGTAGRNRLTLRLGRRVYTYSRERVSPDVRWMYEDI